MAKPAAKQSPFAPSRLPQMPPVPGVRLAACEAGIRYQGRTDLMLAAFDPGTVAAGVLTRSKTSSAGRAVSSSTPATPMPSPARRAVRPRK